MDLNAGLICHIDTDRLLQRREEPIHLNRKHFILSAAAPRRLSPHFLTLDNEALIISSLTPDKKKLTFEYPFLWNSKCLSGQSLSHLAGTGGLLPAVSCLAAGAGGWAGGQGKGPRPGRTHLLRSGHSTGHCSIVFPAVLAWHAMKKEPGKPLHSGTMA